MHKINKVVLAYSGGLDTSVILKWLIETYGCEVVTMTADLGQSDDLSGVEAKALQTGAVKACVVDLREEFARDFVFPMMRAGAAYEGRYLLGTAIARPLIAKALVDVARREGADAVAHGATGKGNDQVRFELGINALAPDIKVVAPWREWNLLSRAALTAFAERHGIPVSTAQKRYSIDENMLHCSFEGAELEDPAEAPHESCHRLCVPVQDAPNTPEYLSIDFKHGDPVAVNGQQLPPAELMATLNTLGGRHGIGRMDMVENRFVGMKSRGVYETPGGTLIHLAHRDLEGLCLDREVMALRDTLIPRYSTTVYSGFWFAPEREAMQALMDNTQQTVTGTVHLKLYKGTAQILSRQSPNTLFCQDLATFEECATFDQKDATGFIRLQSLRLRTFAAMKRRQAR